MTDHNDELIALRKRVEDQRHELARLNALVDDLRQTYLHQSRACRSILDKTIEDMKLRSSLIKSAEGYFLTVSQQDDEE